MYRHGQACWLIQTLVCVDFNPFGPGAAGWVWVSGWWFLVDGKGLVAAQVVAECGTVRENS